ncbi:MAG: hypothetical protein QF886_11995, partial [Planctomycetota bacterium]|nr:hypothetical protein [Planctomycetota bacterium]
DRHHDDRRHHRDDQVEGPTRRTGLLCRVGTSRFECRRLCCLAPPSRLLKAMRRLQMRSA